MFAQKDNFFNQKIELDLDKFKKESDVIIANRFDNCLKDIEEKVYTRDLFKCDYLLNEAILAFLKEMGNVNNTLLNVRLFKAFILYVNKLSC